VENRLSSDHGGIKHAIFTVLSVAAMLSKRTERNALHLGRHQRVQVDPPAALVLQTWSSRAFQ
jgi:hypothetical protein